MNDLTKVIPQLLAQGLLALRENCIMPRLVNSDYNNLTASKGATIDIPIPSAIAAQDVVPGNVPPSTGDVKPTEANIPLDQWKESPFYLTDKDIMEAMNGTIPMQASEAIKSLGNVVDQFILSKYKGLYGAAGVAGTTPFDTDTTDATDARKILNKQIAPLYDRRAVLDPDAEGNALNLRAFQDTSWAGDSTAIKEGLLSPKLGFVWHMDQNVPTHIAGTLTGDPLATVGQTIGDAFITITTDVDDAVALLEGDVLHVAGDAQNYVVGADTAVGASSAVDVPVTPALKIVPAGTEAITVEASHVVNLAFHRDCFAFASRPLADNTQGLGNLIQSAVDPVSGLALRLEISREHKRTRYSYDILFGAAMVRADLGTRLMG